MSTTGRYFYHDARSGRTFCIEPISDRTQKVDDQQWTNGGIDPVLGGAIRQEESIITPENGFRNITLLPAGVSPDGFVQTLLGREVDEPES
ncbi:MAG TPA: hypothetical protein VF263_26120 [Longimicrobiaceae bacterium]